MAKRMLIDAAHPEETRVVVADGNRLEEFDLEASTKKQIKGNIYLAKVTRVEPSLQAAFVSYGGNRHGFLAFSEIDPDYYRIPVADREALMAEQRRLHAEDDEMAEAGVAEPSESGSSPSGEEDGDDEAGGPAEADSGEAREDTAEDGGDEKNEEPDEESNGGEAALEIVGGDDAIDESQSSKPRQVRRYKIQEVIKRNQILLVQVVKEERGTKGAALTTYISLAGRYCVLMHNSPRGGGVSRKITSQRDRRRLKSLLEQLDVPEGMSVILRTAGLNRSKAELKRDFDYLLRTWDQIREKTLESTAPSLIYEEGTLIKRAIRDLYTRDIDEVIVEGEEGYRTAKDFMKMMTPSHAKRVQQYKDETVPLFHRHQIEDQLDAIHSPVVNLKSGGSVVFNPTEALVSIDVNSGRSTRERNIEETALKTNLEAADEIARQLRLRDLAGLVVIDFIDMEQNRNKHAVERRVKDAMKADRARIQVGRISPFGLLELSRQRLRPSVYESSGSTCPHCGGTGIVRSTEWSALQILREIEREGVQRRSRELTVFLPGRVALYLLNEKRHDLLTIEQRYDFKVHVETDPELIPPAFRFDRVKAEPDSARAPRDKRRERGTQPSEAKENQPAKATEAASEKSGSEDADQASRRRRRGKRGGRRRSRRRPAEEGLAAATTDERTTEPESSQDDAPDTSVSAPAHDETATTTARSAEAAPVVKAEPELESGLESGPESGPESEPGPETEATAEEAKPKRRSRKSAKKAPAAPAAPAARTAKRPARKRRTKSAGKDADAEAKPGTEESGPAAPDKPAETGSGNGRDRDISTPADNGSSEPVVVKNDEPLPTTEDRGPKKSGWWNRGT